MAGISSWRVRSQPCTGCGGKVVVVEDRFSGLGGLLRLAGPQRIQHADFEPAVNRVDQVHRVGAVFVPSMVRLVR